MPPKGRRSSAVATRPAGSRRFLRVHSRLSAAHTLKDFFESSPIPNFHDQLLEAYVRAIAQAYESEPEPSAAKSANKTSTTSANSTSLDNDTIQDIKNENIIQQHSSQQSSTNNLEKTFEHDQTSDLNINSNNLPKQKQFLTKGRFSGPENHTNNTPPNGFKFPLPSNDSMILRTPKTFQLPYSVHSTLPKAPLNWKNIKKSMLFFLLTFIWLNFKKKKKNFRKTITPP